MPLMHARPSTASPSPHKNGGFGGTYAGGGYQRASMVVMGDVRPRTPPSGTILQDRYASRITWNNRHTLQFIRERGDVSTLYQQKGLAAIKGLSGEDGHADGLQGIQNRKEQVAGMQSAVFPFGATARTPFQKYTHKVSPFLAHRNLQDTTAATRRYNPDLQREPGYVDAKPWKGTSLPNQRYQYHIVLSNVSLKMDPDGSELLPVQSTGGAKSDSLIPGSSYSNASRFCPTPASMMLLNKSPHMKDGLIAPVTGLDYIDWARKDKVEELTRRERMRTAEHARKLGVEDVEQWLEGLEATSGSSAFAASSSSLGAQAVANRLSVVDCHPNLQVVVGGTAVRPAYSAILDKNYLVRAEIGYTVGVHYWEVRLTRFDVIGEGCHCIGVSAPGDSREAGDRFCMGESKAAAALHLGHCEKVRGGGKLEAYGKRSVKQGDVIGVLIDMRLGEMSFLVNGEDLGVAYRGLRGPLYPAIEMGMMAARDHYYDVEFDLPPPTLKRPSSVLPPSDVEAFSRMKQILPPDSKKANTTGFGVVKGPCAAGGRGLGVGSPITCYPQVGDYVLTGGRRPRTCGVVKLQPTTMLD